MRVYDALLIRDSRQWICSRARGRVLEVGVGTGLNLGHYAEGTRVTGIDLSARMLDVARERAERLGRAVDLRAGDAQALDLADASFDSVVITFALSTIPDDRRALTEARRVLVPGGKLLVLDHGHGRHGAARVAQRLAGFFTARLYADHRDRDPARQIVALGFEIEEMEQVSGGWVLRLAARNPG